MQRCCIAVCLSNRQAAEMACAARVSGTHLPATQQPRMCTHTGCTDWVCRGGVLLARGGVLSLLAPSGADSYTLGILADPRATRRVRRRSCGQPGHISSTACQQPLVVRVDSSSLDTRVHKLKVCCCSAHLGCQGDGIHGKANSSGAAYSATAERGSPGCTTWGICNCHCLLAA